MMMQSGEIQDKFGVARTTLRNWEREGFLGKVIHDPIAGRLYDAEQVERIKAIKQFIDEKKKEKKKVGYPDIQDFILDTYGGMMKEVEETLPVEVESFNSLLLRLSNQDQQLQKVLGENRELLGKVDQVLDENKELQGNVKQVITENEQLKEKMDVMTEKLDELMEELKRKDEEDSVKKTFFQRIFASKGSRSKSMNET